MPSARRALGDRGEELAAAHLQCAGATIVARNWRCRYGEIDLVARMGDQLLFVEVRTRRTGGAPEESVGPTKAERMRRLAYYYLDASGIDPESPWRIDLIVVEIDWAGQLSRLEQIEGAVGEDGP